MRPRLLCAASAAACLLAAPVVAQTAPDQGMAGPASRMDTATADGFVADAAIGDLYEIQAGQLAQQMGRSNGVRRLGAQMVRDHTQMSSYLRAALPAAGVPGPPPAELDARRQRMIGELRNAADWFDRTYLAQQQAAHQEMLLVMNGYAATGDNPTLKSLAGRIAPIVKAHLDHVRQLIAETRR